MNKVMLSHSAGKATKVTRKTLHLCRILVELKLANLWDNGYLKLHLFTLIMIAYFNLQLQTQPPKVFCEKGVTTGLQID